MNSVEHLLVTEIHDRLEIADVLYRFAAGIDFNSEELLTSAFTPQAIVDFTPAAAKLGISFPILEGRDTIVQAFKGSVCLLDTTHTVTNPRTEITGDAAKLYAIVEAQHLPPGNHTRHCLVKSQYELDLVRDRTRWLIERMKVNTVWFAGDPNIIIGK